jgi:hypothetical protein
MDPTDDAALLELCETRWFAGLASMPTPIGVPTEDGTIWEQPVPAILAWPDRLATVAKDGNFDTPTSRPSGTACVRSARCSKKCR